MSLINPFLDQLVQNQFDLKSPATKDQAICDDLHKLSGSSHDRRHARGAGLSTSGRAQFDLIGDRNSEQSRPNRAAHEAAPAVQDGQETRSLRAWRAGEYFQQQL
jgi:hypothetical protein